MTVIPKNINIENIIDAIKEIDLKRLNKVYISESRKYDLIYEGKRYPLKYVLSLANKFANGEELKGFKPNQAKQFFKKFDFEIRVKEKEDIDNDEYYPREEESIIFPEINQNLSIEKLAQIYRDIEDGKNANPPIQIPFDCNVIPASEFGNCKDTLVGIIIDKIDFEKRIPDVLAHHIRCMRQNKNKKIILAVYYWDTNAWEITWKKLFEAVGGEVYIQMRDRISLKKSKN